jgi:hypothetical protein
MENVIRAEWSGVMFSSNLDERFARSCVPWEATVEKPFLKNWAVTMAVTSKGIESVPMGKDDVYMLIWPPGEVAGKAPSLDQLATLDWVLKLGDSIKESVKVELSRLVPHYLEIHDFNFDDIEETHKLLIEAGLNTGGIWQNLAEVQAVSIGSQKVNRPPRFSVTFYWGSDIDVRAVLYFEGHQIVANSIEPHCENDLISMGWHGINK